MGRRAPRRAVLMGGRGGKGISGEQDQRVDCEAGGSRSWRSLEAKLRGSMVLVLEVVRGRPSVATGRWAAGCEACRAGSHQGVSERDRRRRGGMMEEMSQVPRNRNGLSMD